MWFKLDKDFFGFEKRNVFLCFFLYSTFQFILHLRTNFDKLEGDITKYSISGDIMLMGDVNAHINNNDLDFIRDEVDYSLDNFLPSNYIADSVSKYTKLLITMVNSYLNYVLITVKNSQQKNPR